MLQTAAMTLSVSIKHSFSALWTCQDVVCTRHVTERHTSFLSSGLRTRREFAASKPSLTGVRQATSHDSSRRGLAQSVIPRWTVEIDG